MGKLYCDIAEKWCKYLKKGNCAYCNSPVGEVSYCPRLKEIETIRFSELIKDVKFEDVFKTLCKWFNDQEVSKEGYEKVFNELIDMTPHKHNLSDLFIKVDKVNEDGCEYLDTYGVSLNSNVSYGLEFTPWVEWISRFITKDTLERLSKEEIVGACLYEMTFFGFSERKIEENKQSLIDSYNECLKIK